MAATPASSASPATSPSACKSATARVALPGLPPALDGLNLVHLADLHMAPCYDRRYFEAIADEVARLEPDLIVCTGDIVEHPDAIAWIEPILGRLRGRLGQFAILGNHDLLYDTDRIRAAIASAGFTDLDGRWTRLEADGAYDRPRRHVRPLGASPRPDRPARRRPRPRPQPHPRPLLPRRPLEFRRSDALRPQPRRPGPPAAWSAPC